MTPDDFRRLALSFPDTEEGSHVGAADFRTGNRIFATLASQDKGFGNLMLTPALQADFLADRPDLFLPIHGGWGRMGMTHIRLAEADEDTLAGALYTAYKHRIQRNEATASKRSRPRRK
jgi:hypothetical protein